MSKKRMAKTRHPSMEMPEDGKDKKKQDVLSKARSKLYNFGDSWKSTKCAQDEIQKKSLTQSTLDYFFKACPNKTDRNQIYSNNNNAHIKRASSLQKQHSVGAYPIKADLSDTEDVSISRSRPATICGDKINEARETAALALERPRKKLSFREPEIMGYSMHKSRDKERRKNVFTPEMRRSVSVVDSTSNRRALDFEDLELESQAMRVVRTVGQAFEVCHKLSITAPENENLDYDEQDTLTQDLVSDRLSDINSDKPKKDAFSEGASDKFSLQDEDLNCLDNNISKNSNKTMQLDFLPTPTSNHSTRKSPTTPVETYLSPNSDNFINSGSGGSGTSSLPAGSSLSIQHELQLLKEQLDQQTQQTQAALAQLQLAREQLNAEQSARMEAQARTHQLLVHNRELLDHISALVAHLQGGDKAANIPQVSPHVTMPQQQQGLSEGGFRSEMPDGNSLEHSSVMQALGLNPQGLIENRAVTSCLPSSPLRAAFNPGGGVFNFNYQQDLALETQLLQRLQALGGYSPPQYPCGYNQNLAAFLPGLYANPLVNNNYTLQPPPQKKFTTSPLPLRHSYSGSPVFNKRMSPATSNEAFQSQQNLQLPNVLQLPTQQANYQQPHNYQQNFQQNNYNPTGKNERKSEPRYIKPLSQMGTLTTTDSSGRVRVIVPVSPNPDEAAEMLSSLKVKDDDKPNVSPITRSISEKVPHRSDLMSEQKRTWARHTTK